MTLGQALRELTLFWNFLAVAVVQAEDDSLLFLHGNKTDLEYLHQALAFVNCHPRSEAGERPMLRISRAGTQLRKEAGLLFSKSAFVGRERHSFRRL
jgi:hypothetical protein